LRETTSTAQYSQKQQPEQTKSEYDTMPDISLTKGECIMSDRLVYSTETGRISTCPNCGKPYKQCTCDQPVASTKKSDGIVRIMRDRKGRGGKTMTVITGLPASTLTTLAQQLKKLCGSGGTVKDGNIEIQGDHCEKVQAKLTDMGYKVKRAGG
jgi:translation initiation factor 1